MANNGSYLVELDRWSIKNDDTDAVATSRGINEALVWAKQQGYAEVFLPRGSYLIDENNPVQPQSHMTFNLGGSTLRIRDNASSKYAIVSFRETEYARITNGKIVGDRYTHDYSSGGTHEFGVGVEVLYGNEYVTVDNLEIFHTTGDAIIAITSFGGIGGSFPNIAGNLEAGGINLSNGSLTSSSNRIRSSVNIPIIPQIKNSGYFGIYGDSYGGLGSEITTDTYDVVFYKNDGSFVKSETNLHLFDEVAVPPEADYAKVVLHQGTVPSPSGIRAMIRTPQFPKHVYIEKCHLHHCRRLGIAICGVKHFYVKGCEIHHISGAAPAGAIDVEDGYDLNQHIYIEGNNIYDSGINIIAVAGRYITVKKNKIRTGIFSMSAGVNKAIVEGNHFIDTNPRLVGESIFANNHLYSSKLDLIGSAKALVNNSYFHNSTLSLSKDRPYVASLNQSRFYFDDDFYNASTNPGAPIHFRNEPQTLSSCSFEGSGFEAFTSLQQGSQDWVFQNVSFINTEHRSGRKFILPPGVYTGCTFKNPGSFVIHENPTAVFDFNGCTFEWESYHLFYLRTNIAMLRVQNCNFINDSRHSAFFLWTISGKVEFMNNVYEYLGSDSRANFIQFWADTFLAKYVMVNDSRFISDVTITAIDASKLSPSIPVISENNLHINANGQFANHHMTLNNRIL